MKAWIACAALLFPLLSHACASDDRRRCKKELAQLVALRAEAIAAAFGDLSAALPAKVNIRFMKQRDPDRPRLQGDIGYDAESHMLVISLAAVGAKTPNPPAAQYYWPFYRNDKLRMEYPIIAKIDNALWGAFLQEAARSHGLTWPHTQCGSLDISKRLPCEMLVSAVEHQIRMPGIGFFNDNRIDRIWPDDLEALEKRTSRYDHPEYRDARRYGGILLLRPLIGEFGVTRVLSYIARTPFEIEANSVRASAVQYQERAREALRAELPQQRHALTVSIASPPADDDAALSQ